MRYLFRPDNTSLRRPGYFIRTYVLVHVYVYVYTRVCTPIDPPRNRCQVPTIHHYPCSKMNARTRISARFLRVLQYLYANLREYFVFVLIRRANCTPSYPPCDGVVTSSTPGAGEFWFSQAMRPNPKIFNIFLNIELRVYLFLRFFIGFSHRKPAFFFLPVLYCNSFSQVALKFFSRCACDPSATQLATCGQTTKIWGLIYPTWTYVHVGTALHCTARYN